MLCIKIHTYIFLSRILRATEGPRLLCTAPTVGSRTARTGAPLPLFCAHGGSRPRCATLGSIGAFRLGFVPWRYIFLSFYCYGFAPLPLARIRVPVGSMGSGARHYRITKETFLFLSRLRTDTAERCRISEGFVLFHFILLEQRNGSSCFNSFSRITGAVLKILFFFFFSFFLPGRGIFFHPENVTLQPEGLPLSLFLQTAPSAHPPPRPGSSSGCGAQRARARVALRRDWRYLLGGRRAERVARNVRNSQVKSLGK